MSIEEKLKNTLLQKPKPIEVGNRVYDQSPPTIATLAEFSALVSTLPSFNIESEHILKEVIDKAKDTKISAQILATLILGVKRPKKWKFLRLFADWKLKDLSEYILYNIHPSEYAAIYAQCVKGLEVSDFFYTMHFLKEGNLLKPTKKTNQIRSTRQSPDSSKHSTGQ